MRYYLLPLFSLALALPLTAAAQAPADTATTYKHQLGLTASPVLDGFFKNNRSLPLGLLYKRQLTPNKALRVRLVGQYNRRDTTDFATLNDGTGERFWQLDGFVGYEWQRRLGRRFGWQYGAELGAGWSRRTSLFNTRYVDSEGPLSTEGSFVTKIWQVQARPFVGMRFQLSSRVDVFAESAAIVSYQRRRDNGDFTVSRPGLPSQYPYSYFTRNSFRLYWQPIQLIGASFKF